MDDCIFCKIVKGEIPCTKIYEDEKYLAFLDIAIFSKGHTLVIPKKHYRFFSDVEDIEGYFRVVKKICLHYRNKLGFEYVDTITLGRMIPHSHVHLIPHNGDGDWSKLIMDSIPPLQNDQSRRKSPEEMEEIAKEFRID